MSSMSAPQHAGHNVLMCWHRQSGSTAVLPCTAPTNAAVFGLRYSFKFPPQHAAPSLPPTPPELRAPAPVPAPRMAVCLAANSSPRALGDVPLLLSEQRLWGSGGSVATTEPVERRTRGGSAFMDACSASREELADSAGPRHARSESFGADYKAPCASAVFAMDWDSDAD